MNSSSENEAPLLEEDALLSKPISLDSRPIEKPRSNDQGGSTMIDAETSNYLKLLEPTKNEFEIGKDYLKKLKKAVLKTNPDFINDHNNIGINGLDTDTSIVVLSTELNSNYLSNAVFLNEGKAWKLKKPYIDAGMRLGVNPDTGEIEILNFDNANIFGKDGKIRADLFHQVETVSDDSVNDTIEVQTNGLVNRGHKEIPNPTAESMFFELDNNPIFLAHKIEQELRGFIIEVMRSSFVKEHLSDDDVMLFYYDMIILEPERLLHTKEPLTDLQEKVVKSLATLKKYTLLLKSKVKDAEGNKIYNPLKKMKMIRNIIGVSTTTNYDEKTLTKLKRDDTIVDDDSITQGLDDLETLIDRSDTESSKREPKDESDNGGAWLD